MLHCGAYGGPAGERCHRGVRAEGEPYAGPLQAAESGSLRGPGARPRRCSYSSPGLPQAASKAGCMLATTPSSAKVAMSASEIISTCSRRCRAARMRSHAERCRRPAQPEHGSCHGVVADAVKAGLQSGPGACDHMIGDLLFGQIAGTAGLGIGVRLTQRCGTRADRAVDAKITGQPCHPSALRPFDGRLGGELAPIRRDAHTKLCCDLANSGEILDRSKMGAAQFVHRRRHLAPPLPAVPLRAADRRSWSVNSRSRLPRHRWCASRVSSPSAR